MLLLGLHGHQMSSIKCAILHAFAYFGGKILIGEEYIHLIWYFSYIFLSPKQITSRTIEDSYTCCKIVCFLISNISSKNERWAVLKGISLRWMSTGLCFLGGARRCGLVAGRKTWSSEPTTSSQKQLLTTALALATTWGEQPSPQVFPADQFFQVQTCLPPPPACPHPPPHHHTQPPSCTCL